MAMISDVNGRWELHDPDRAVIAYRHTDDTYSAGRWHHTVRLVDRTTEPYRDDVTVALVDELIDSLIVMRSGSTGDGGAQLSVIASLLAELDSRVPEAVFQARDQDYTWRHIAGRLAMVESTIRRHYADYVACRKQMPLADLD
jgi:hypothetical protein